MLKMVYFSLIVERCFFFFFFWSVRVWLKDLFQSMDFFAFSI